MAMNFPPLAVAWWILGCREESHEGEARWMSVMRTQSADGSDSNREPLSSFSEFM